MYENVVQGCFIMNKFYSARFGTCYIIQLKNLEEAGRGTREEFDGDGISVFRNNLNIRSLQTMLESQRLIKNAKAAGGIKSYLAQGSTCEK